MKPYEIKKPVQGWLHKQTMMLLIVRPKPVRIEDVAAQSGVSVAWIKSFLANKIADPSANRLEAVYNVLASKPLGE